jgi:ATP-binding cassette subfamily F protein 2
MSSIDALATAINEYEGGVVIVSHDFRTLETSHLYIDNHLTRLGTLGLISQVARELWEVKDKKIRNLTKEDIDIKSYKAMLVKDSEYIYWP